MLEGGGGEGVALSLRIPTAPNQYKDPYVLMEAEAGNSSDVALKEFHFHLQGRLTPEEIGSADWFSFFKAAAKKLGALRAGTVRMAASAHPRKAARGPTARPRKRRR